AGDPSMSHEPCETLAAIYAVGALDGDEVAQFEAHLPTCPACQAAVRDAEETLARAVLTASPQVPPAAAREALVRRVAERRDVRSRAWLRWAAATLVAAGAAAVFAGTWVAVRYEARLGQMAREMAAAQEAVREDVALDPRAGVLLGDPAARCVARRAREGAARARGHVSSARGGSSVVPRLAVGDRRAACADPAALEPCFIEPRDLHAVAGLARVHEPAIADIDAAVIETVEEHDVARRELLT